jgi:diaminohydroxyphosphoribosylaminopyrimidine deaminase/5-amino-6-(5-phosphoribosylamino)uracil reductase
VGCVDPFAKVQGRGIQRIREAGIEVTVGVLEKECQWLNRRFFTYHKKHRPYIILKWAQTDNGFIDDHGHPLAISSPFTKMLVHQQRAREDAIVVGRLTAEKEQPQLNVREWSGPSPVRFVLSGKEEYFGNLITVKSIDDLLGTCYERQLQSLIVEGGLATLQSFLDRGLWDELRVEKAPLTVDDGTPAPAIPAEAQAFSEECYDGRKIVRFRAPSF